jgi:hypothetical protein
MGFDALIGTGKFLLKAADCILHPEKLPQLITYDLPKAAFETASAGTLWGARKVSEKIGLVTPEEDKLLYQKVSEWISPTPQRAAYNKLIENTDKLSNEATGIVTGKTIKQVAANSWYTDSPFKAVDLIGPALLLGICTNKALSHLSSALHHAKLLIINKKFVSTAYQIPALNSSTMAIVEKTRRYTIPGLAKDTAMEAIFAALWSAGVVCTYQGIYNAVLEASSYNAAQASFIANALLAAGVVAPYFYKWIEEAIYMPEDTQHKSSKIAPQFDYTDPKEKDFVEINKAHTLTLEQKLALLEKYREQAKGG